MKRIMALCLMLALAAPLLCPSARAEESRDITGQCVIRVSAYKNDKDKMLDESNMTMWYQPEKNAWVEVQTPEGVPGAGIVMRWGVAPVDVVIERAGEAKGEWIPVQTHLASYFTEYIAFDQPLSHFRVRPVEKEVRYGIIKIQVMSEGDLPAWVQTWQPFEDKADMMVLVAHPDDELLYMGGVIPYYTSQMGKKVVVMYVARMSGFRLVEALDGLWHCGVRLYPELPNGKFRDEWCSSLKKCLSIWDDEKLLDYVTEMIRKYRPDVIVTHDVNGEYGHGAHRACCWAVQKCITRAADPDQSPVSAAQYGPWQVKKAYIHLYRGELGQIDFDWRQPLSAFDGKTAFEVTDEAFHKHRSQAASGKYVVEDFGKYDNSLFGLYYSTVGPDTGENDMLEHLE
ncbi:MAG: PIG-L family deacetylase [Clostridia bacterium]|nr:PIG-L family deacetylase [Clostridia bacterium]